MKTSTTWTTGRKVTPETALKNSVKHYLRLKGWLVVPILQGLGAHRGISDLICLKAGQTIFLELKRPKGQQSEPQKAFQADIEAHGGNYLICRSIDDLIKEGI